MARGRMLNKKISMSKQMARLDEKCGPYAVIIITWLISHLDVDGRFHGEPILIKGTVVPWLEKATLKLIEQTLEAAEELGIVRWYSVDGTKYIDFPKFHNNQGGLRKAREAKSEIPPCPEDYRSNSGVTPEEVRTNSGLTKHNLSKHNSSKDNLMHVRSVVGHYRKIHPGRGKHLTPKHKDWKLIQERLNEGFSAEDLCLAIDGNRIDKWHKNNRKHSIEYIFRNTTKTEDFIETARKGVRLDGWLGATQDFIEESENGQNGESDFFGDYVSSSGVLSNANSRRPVEGNPSRVLSGARPLPPACPQQGSGEGPQDPQILFPDSGATLGTGGGDPEEHGAAKAKTARGAGR